MKSSSLVFVPIALLVIAIGGFFAFNGQEPGNNVRRIETDPPLTVVDNGIDLATSGGEYVEFNPEADIVSQLGDDKNLLFFHAKWCPTCLSLDRNLIAGTVPDGVTIVKLDFDDETELKELYGVTFQHTLVQVDENGEFLNRFFGSRDIEEIVEATI